MRSLALGCGWAAQWMRWQMSSDPFRGSPERYERDLAVLVHRSLSRSLAGF
jgi:hypothetical protein